MNLFRFGWRNSLSLGVNICMHLDIGKQTGNTLAATIWVNCAKLVFLRLVRRKSSREVSESLGWME